MCVRMYVVSGDYHVHGNMGYGNRSPMTGNEFPRLEPASANVTQM